LLMRGKIGTSEENLETALQNEKKAKKEYYPEMVKDARDSSKAVKKAFAQSMETDGQHANLFERAKTDMPKNDEADYYVCHICGHISVGFVPENCPVCHAVSGRFKRVV
jgi:rubrerythrin